MNHDSVISISENLADILTKLLREGAQKMLAQAVESEVREYLKSVNLEGVRVIRNGKAPARKIMSGLGPIEVRRQKLRSKSNHDAPKFTSKLLPPYLRKSKSLEELIPWLYLKGVSSSDMESALQPLLGKHLSGFSASTVTTLTRQWIADYEAWNKTPINDN